MILRAVFWIAVVSFFMPREPDLGLGRPSDGIGTLMAQVEQGADPAKVCDNHVQTCAAGLSLFNLFQGFAVRSLDAVKADIEQSRARHPVEDTTRIAAD
jgi:hypothetical protein